MGINWWKTRFIQRIKLLSGIWKNHKFILHHLCNRDTGRNLIEYEPVAIIEFQGTVGATGESNGHYICDIKEKSSGLWFRTNDNLEPRQIGIEAVTKNAYVILYRKLDA